MYNIYIYKCIYTYVYIDIYVYDYEQILVYIYIYVYSHIYLYYMYMTRIIPLIQDISSDRCDKRISDYLVMASGWFDLIFHPSWDDDPHYIAIFGSKLPMNKYVTM